MDSPIEYKVVLIGNCNVGKTSLITSYQSSVLSSGPTIAASYVQFPIQVKNATVILNVWDTAGHEKFQSLVPMYARTADALLIVFDITSSETFEGAKKWYDQIIEEVGEISTVVLCANKEDLNPSADTAEFEEWAKEKKMKFATVSAKTGKGIQNLFYMIAESVSDSVVVTESTTTELIIKEDKKGCC